MQVAKTSDPLADRISDVLKDFTEWLDAYGETSWDYQSFFAGPVGGRAKSLYYRNRLIGTMAVAPMIFCEAFLPGARRLFHHPIRFPIADAHYAMGFAFLYEATGDLSQLEVAVPRFQGILLGLSFQLGLARRHRERTDSTDHNNALCL